MSGLAFSNPWMLAAVAAVGLPVLIHYLTRARPRRIAFPPFRFLAEACAGRQAVNRLRTLILLIVRCLAVLAMVLLFARPYVKPTGAAANTQASRRVVLVVDASLSMRAAPHGAPLFARAQAEAADVLRSLDSGSEAAIIMAGATPRALLPALSRNIAALHDELVKAQPTYELGNPAAALALAKQMLNGPGQVYVFSDFQKANWESAGALPAGVAFRLRPVTTEPVDNLGLTSIRLSPAQPVAGEAVEVLCTVLNCTAKARQETVRLELGDFAQESRVTIQPFSTADAPFSVTFAQPGVLNGKALLQPDDLLEDNTRFVSVNVSKSHQIALISDSDRTDRRSAAFFVERALAPSAQSAPGLSVVRRHGQDTDRGVLETADTFVLAAPVALSGEAIEVIGRRVEDGAHLIVFLDGPQAATLIPAAFNPPFQLSRSINIDDTLVAGAQKLFTDSDADWAGLHLKRHWQNRTLPGRADETILSYSDGSSALTMTALGKGTVVYANLPLTPDGGDLPGSPLFPSMLHELMRNARRGSAELAVTPGAAWTLDVPTALEGPVTVNDPPGHPVQAQAISSGRVTRLALPNARQPGIYAASQNNLPIGAGVVNIDPRESDTRPIALENLKSSPGAAVSVIRNEEELLLAGATRPLWPLFGGAAIAAIALEMLLLTLWRRTASDRPPVKPPGPARAKESVA